jgi:hypothetical protein
MVRLSVYSRLTLGLYGFVFTSPIGTAFDPRKATREFHALLEAAKLPSIRTLDHQIPGTSSFVLAI